MQKPPVRGVIRPKISTMPRQQNEPTAYLSIYKLTVERKRLKQELESIEQRRERIQTRLQVLDQQVQELEAQIQRMRESDGQVVETTTTPTATDSSSTFDLLYVDY